MKRSEFIQSVTGLGIISLLNPIESLAETEKSTIYIGLGGAGTNMAKGIKNNGIKGEYYSINNLKQDNWDNVLNFIPFKSTLNEESNAQEFINAANEVLIDNIFQFHPNYHYKILVGLGGTTGTLLALAIDKKLKNSSINYEINACIPFEFETKRRALALEVATILKFGKHTTLFDLQHFKNRLGNHTFNNFFEKINGMLL
jgi:cell division GTPase FtsZ